MGTTKLTRKQIADDPIHDMLVSIVDFVRTREKVLVLGAVVVAVIGAGIYWGMDYLEARDMEAQQELGRAMDIFHAQVDPSVTGKTDAAEPVFPSEEARYKAAAEAFSRVTAEHGRSKAADIARFYQGICQYRLGKKEEGIRTLEALGSSGADRTLRNMSKKLLATYYLDTGNSNKAQAILEGMIKDPQCGLPKVDLKVALSRVYAAQGKNDEAVKLLQEARDSGEGGLLQSQVFQELRKLEEGSPAARP